MSRSEALSQGDTMTPTPTSPPADVGGFILDFERAAEPYMQRADDHSERVAIRKAAKLAIQKANSVPRTGMGSGLPRDFGVYEVPSTPPGGTCEILAVHVVPEYGPAHTMVGDTCDCKPTIEWFPNGNALVVHSHMFAVPPPPSDRGER